MPSYIESALYDFVKTILTRGIRTLKSPRFFPYSAFLLLIVTITTVTTFLDQVGQTISPNTRDIMLFVELSVSISFIVVGLFLGRLKTSIQMILLIGGSIALSFLFYNNIIPSADKVAINIAALLYIFWLGIVAFSTFALFRDLFANETVGTVLFLGKPEDDGKVMFSVFAWLFVIINFALGYVIYSKATTSGVELSGLGIMALSIIALLPLLGFQRKHDVFYTILTCFFMFTTIKVSLFTFKVLSGSKQSSSLWDILFSLFMALYTIQNAAVKGINIGKKLDDDDEEEEKDEKSKKSLEERLMDEEQGVITRFLNYLLTDRGIVLVILGIVLGYHTMQVQTILGKQNIFNDLSFTKDADIVILGYEVNIVITLVIYVVSLFFFFIFPPFRHYANPEVNRIQWLPPYDELREVFAGIRSGEINWKMDMTKMIVGMGKDMVAQKLGRKKKKKTNEERFNSFWGKLRRGGE